MPRLHKLRRRQKFQYNVRRKLVKKNKEKLPRIKCDAIRKAWDERKSLNDNLTSMGLIADANAHPSFRVSSGREQMRPSKSPNSKELLTAVVTTAEQGSVVEALVQESKASYTSKKAIAHPLPKPMVKKLTSLLDKHGEDYEAMSRDYENYNQETPAQLRSQVNRLKQVPQQWVPYLKSRGLLPAASDTPAHDQEVSSG